MISPPQPVLGIAQRGHLPERPVIVLGMHRSGTSLLAELLDKCGVFGNDESLPADSRNPRGYWEYAPLVHFNRRLLASIGSHSFLPPADEDDLVLCARASELPWKNEAARLASAMRAHDRAWYWKDPRLAVTFPFWQQFWGEPAFVIAVREPFDIARSLQKRDGLPISAGLLLWQRYMMRVLRNTETCRPRVFVQYERLLSEPEAECHRLCTFLSTHCQLGGATAEHQRREQMISAISPELRRNANDGSFLTRPEGTIGQKHLYQHLQSMADGRNKSFDLDAVEIYPGWRDYLQALADLEEMRGALRGIESRPLVKIQQRFSTRSSTQKLPW